MFFRFVRLAFLLIAIALVILVFGGSMLFGEPQPPITISSECPIDIAKTPS
ncbi:MAG TPA: hypothetical protein VLB83_01765 [Candidatus Paceibacterota bacterium]|nr:hypothetical protein [Candidatus Paceibacterota bacterium]